MSLDTNIELSEHSRTSPTDANFYRMEKYFFAFMTLRGWVGCLLTGKHSTKGGFLIKEKPMWEIHKLFIRCLRGKSNIISYISNFQ